jgi:hypothetical protein
VGRPLNTHFLLFLALLCLYDYLYFDWDLKHELREVDRSFGFNITAYNGRGAAGWVFVICLFFLLLRLLGLY